MAAGDMASSIVARRRRRWPAAIEGHGQALAGMVIGHLGIVDDVGIVGRPTMTNNGNART